MTWGTRRPARTLGALASVAALALTVGCEARAVEGAGTDPGPQRPSEAGSHLSVDTGWDDPKPDTDAERRAPSQPEPASGSRTPAPADAKPGGDSPRPHTPAPAASAPAKPSPAAPATTAPPPDPSAPVLAEGAQGSAVREVQARLLQLRLFERNPTGYYGTITSTAVRSFQGSRGLAASGTTDAATWRTLRAQTRKPTAMELDPPTSLPLAVPDPRCTTGRALCVSKKSRTLAWMVNGRVVSAMDVRFGTEYTPTREGTFKVDFKSRDHHSTLYDTPMPYAMFFSGGQAVHYSADFAAAGYNGGSHGCVNVRDKEKVAKLFDAVKPGDKVIVYS
ncbi:L,D-transpeptidase family protein [Streptomyces sp. 549]|uniref:L,D-transpeptidase family protein n=1 Tax=Streptomyces sp. 549 TaxID=3049076 RepID=UPI0024C4257D|nr:L,D-transpeptidase family protein [Streptomyces sp. 549]MDK1472723.1 L,D-transpeptidase family protein [Streptomyces sp. 549]